MAPVNVLCPKTKRRGCDWLVAALRQGTSCRRSCQASLRAVSVRHRGSVDRRLPDLQCRCVRVARDWAASPALSEEFITFALFRN